MHSNHLESVERVMRVLECFTLETPELRLTDISQRLNMPKPQTHRILTTLEHGYFLSRDPVTKRYRLGIQVFQLGMIVREKNDIHRIVLPYLQQLVEETQETAGLVVPNELEPMCFEQVESPRIVRVFSPLGKRLPWYADTSPKLLLAFVSENEREAIMSRNDFLVAEQEGHFSRSTLLLELESIRANGYYIGGRRHEDDGVAVSAPVFDHQHRVVGAVNLAGPAQRLSDGALEFATQRVVEVAREVSRELGCNSERHARR